MYKKIGAVVSTGCLSLAAAFGFGPISGVIGSALHSPTIASANAVPGQCGSGGFFGTGGGFCDGPAWPDGSWYHCVEVRVFGIGGGGCGQVCPNPNPALAPIPTDSDPATPC